MGRCAVGVGPAGPPGDGLAAGRTLHLDWGNAGHVPCFASTSVHVCVCVCNYGGWWWWWWWWCLCVCDGMGREGGRPLVACLWSPSSPRRVCEVARKVKTRPMVFSCGGFADEPLPRTACASIPRLLCSVVMYCRFWRSCTFGMPMLHARSPCSDAVARCAGSARWSHRVPPCRTLPAPGRQRVVPWHRGSQACFCAGRKSSVRGWVGCGGCWRVAPVLTTPEPLARRPQASSTMLATNTCTPSRPTPTSPRGTTGCRSGRGATLRLCLFG